MTDEQTPAEAPVREAVEPAPAHWSKLAPAGGAMLSFSEYGEAIGDASGVLRNNLAAAGLEAAVPTCPGWNVRDLLVHTGLAQRWCTAVLTDGVARPDEKSLLADLGDYPDPLDWLDDGVVELLNALVRADPEGDYFFFLKNASASKREAWARRQCHEATIHAVDAMAARLGAAPSATHVWFSARLAVDGIDELLRGFVPKRSSPLRAEAARTLAVRVSEAEEVAVPGGGWTVTFGPEGATCEYGVEADADATITGSAVGVYLGLWNRGQEYEVIGDQSVAQTFSHLMKVEWSG